MNRKIATVALFAAAALTGNAFADDITVDHTPFHATKTRAEVQAELAAFKKAGTSPWSTQYNPLASFRSTRGAEQVRADYLASRQEVAAFNGEDSGSTYLTQAGAHGAVPAALTTLAGQPRNANNN